MGMSDMQDSGSNWLIKLAQLVLHYMSWKLVAQLAVSAALGGSMYVAWEARGKLSTLALSHWANPEIHVDRLPALVEGLSDELQPESIFIWSANPGADTRRPIYVWISGVRRQEMENRVEPLYPDDPEKLATIVRLIRSEVLCTDHTPWSPTAKVLSDAGINWMCAVGIPPESTSLVGGITVGFAETRTVDYTRIQAAMRRWANFAAGRDMFNE